MLYKPPRGSKPINGHWARTGLVGHWIGWEGSGGKLYDVSGNENHGELNHADPSTPTSGWNPGSLGGPVLAYDGSDDSADTPFDFSGRTQFTISCWAKRRVVNSVVYLAQSDDNNNNLQIGFFSDGNLYLSVDDVQNNYALVASNDANWNHTVMVFDGNISGNSGRLKLFLNGTMQTLAFVGNIEAVVGPLTNKFKIGTRDFGGIFTDGLIDDVRIYNRALSVAEIRMLYSEHFPAYPGIEAALVTLMAMERSVSRRVFGRVFGRVN